MMNKTDEQDNNSTTSTATAPKEDNSVSPQEASSMVVTKLASNDVLMGRGAAVIGNEGNRRFRKLIQKYKVEYDATRIRQEKDRIARKIVETITARQGRFLKRIDTPAQAEFFKVSEAKTAWVVVKEAVVLQKVKQAFRDDRRSFEEDRSNNSKNVSSGGVPILKAPLGDLKKSPMALESLLGDSTLIGNPALVNHAFLMQQNASTLGNIGFLPTSPQQQQLFKSQLDSQMLAQLLVARQSQQQLTAAMNPLAALRLQAAAASEHAFMDENHRAVLLRQFLASQPTGPSALAVRQAMLREQLSALGAAAPAGASSQAQQLPTSAFLR